jgi:hypothetical protein
VLVSLLLISALENGHKIPQSRISTPYRTNEVLQVRSVRLKSTSIPIYQPQQIEIDLSATFDNPFDPRDIDVRLDVNPEKGPSFTLPCYFTIECARSLVDGVEVTQKIGKPVWKANLALLSEGRTKLSVVAKDRTSTAFSEDFFIDGKSPSSDGYVTVSQQDKKYFATTNGKSFYPIGTNLCWGGDKGTYHYDEWIPKLADNGVNTIRLWLSPFWTTFALDQPGKAKDGKGMGVFSLENLSKLDRVVDLARSRGMRVKFCIESYNVLREKDAYNKWEETPHNALNGGPLFSPSNFFNNSEMDQLFLQKLRYLVARYSADPTIFAWEFWNEVDLTTGFDSNLVKDWHQRMAKELRKLDPYAHMITTSFSDPSGAKEIDLLNEMDYLQTHTYSNPEVLSAAAVQQSRKGNWGKPHYVGEIGADFAGPRTVEDPKGYQIHDPLWMSIAMGASGTSQPWWWDNLIAPKELWSLWKPASEFVQGIEWDKESFRQTQPTFAWQTKSSSAVRRDLILSNGPKDFSNSTFNKPRTVKISSAGASGDVPLSTVLHGTRNHPEWHNPITFKVDLPRPTRFDLVVDGVSGYGGGTLQFELDGSVILTREFKDPDESTITNTLKQYDSTYSVTLPAGKHNFIVKNIGADWIMGFYRFKDLVVKETPPLIGWSVIGDSTALAWVRSDERNWAAVTALKDSGSIIPPTTIGIEGLAAGEWKCDVWNTWTGKIEASTINRVVLDGKLRVLLPVMEHDFAVKATKIQRQALK